MSPSYHVFLSHSSADKPAVETLARKLLEAGIKPFFDKWELVPGETWQEDLEKALKNSETCAVFIGSHPLGPWHNEELRSAISLRARNKSFRVIPVLLPGSLEPSSEELPLFLQRFTWADFRTGLNDEDSFRYLVSGIHGTTPGPGEGGKAVPLKRRLPYRCMAQPPEEWIHRQEYDDVLEALCLKEGAEAGRSVGITTALRGAGGFGKTALAQKLCFDERVREAYPDGILWATMGEEADSNSRLKQIRDLILWWAEGKEVPAFETLNAAGARLRELLNGSRVLVVVDDVWSPDDVASFHGLGAGCALLITTRDSRTLPADSSLIKVDAMASSEAIHLLRAGLPDNSPGDFESLAAQLGEWPLLLKLVNGQLREMVAEGGISIPEALREIQEALTGEGFSAFDKYDSDSRHGAASRAILLSVRRLTEKEKDLFLQLAVFPEDEDIPVSVLGRYWGLSHFSTSKICQHLYDLSLLLRFDRKSGTIRLHDVIRRVLVEQSGEALRSLHVRILEAYRPPRGKWADLPIKENYLWRRFWEHFLGAGFRSEFKALLMSFPFIEAKLLATDINSLISDFETFAGEDQELRLVRDALRLSAHILVKDPAQLASQLFGRLRDRDEESIRTLMGEARVQRSDTGLWPRAGSLTQPGGALVRTLEGHTAGVNAVAVVNGQKVISAAYDGMLRLWDLETGQTLRTLEGHTTGVNAVAVVDNRHAISASTDGTLRLWDLETGQALRTFEGHSAGVRAVAVVDEQCAISASADWTLRLWDLQTGQTLRTLKGHSAGVRAVTVINGRRAISASTDRTLRLWSLETGQALRTLEGHSAGVRAVAMVDSQRVISCSDDEMLRLWDLETGQTLRIFEGHSDWVRAVAVMDSQRIVSASDDRTLRLWDLETGQTIQALEGHSAWVNAVASVDGRRAISASDDRTLRLWDLETGQPPRTLEGHLARVRAVAVVDGQRAVSASDDGTLRLWNLETGPTPRTLEGHLGKVNAVAVVDSQRAISAANDGTLRLWELETGQTLRVLEGHSARVNGVAVVDSRYAVSACNDGTLRLWDLESGQTLRTLKGHSAIVNAVAVVDSRHAVSASADRTLRIWDLKNGQTLKTLKGHTNGVRAVAVVKGRFVISASSDRTLRVWDLETGQTLQSLEGHTTGVKAVTVIGSRRAVSASDDRTLRVWNLESGKVLAVMTLDSPVWAVAATPDSRMVVAGDQSGRVHFFDLVKPE